MKRLLKPIGLAILANLSKPPIGWMARLKSSYGSWGRPPQKFMILSSGWNFSNVINTNFEALHDKGWYMTSTFHFGVEAAFIRKDYMRWTESETWNDKTLCLKNYGVYISGCAIIWKRQSYVTNILHETYFPDQEPSNLFSERNLATMKRYSWRLKLICREKTNLITKMVSKSHSMGT